MFFVVSNTPVKSIPKGYFLGDEGHYYIVEDGLDRGKKVFYYDFETGVGDVECTVLFVHGNPESSYTYAPARDALVKKLSAQNKNARIVAMDHIGFGLSDQADYEMIDVHHADNLRQFILALDLQNVVLVVHDWGGPIGIGSFVRDAERVSALVVMNTSIFPMPTSGFTYRNYPFRWIGWNQVGNCLPPYLWRYIPPLVIYSPIVRWPSLKYGAKYLARILFGRLTEDERFYRDSFSTKNNALSSMRNVRQTHVWGHGYEYVDAKHGQQSNRKFYRDIQDIIPAAWGRTGKRQGIPVRAFFGELDPLAREEVLDQWRDAFPQLQGHIKTYPEIGHWVEEHEFEDVAQGIFDVVVELSGRYVNEPCEATI